jgi:hypothetical protein
MGLGYTPQVPMHVSGKSVDQLLAEIREAKKVPLGIVTYQPDTERFDLYVFGDQNMGEVAAVLQKIGVFIKEQ